jgi:hypothetical protein
MAQDRCDGLGRSSELVEPKVESDRALDFGSINARGLGQKRIKLAYVYAF